MKQTYNNHIFLYDFLSYRISDSLQKRCENQRATAAEQLQQANWPVPAEQQVARQEGVRAGNGRRRPPSPQGGAAVRPARRGEDDAGAFAGKVSW